MKLLASAVGKSAIAIVIGTSVFSNAAKAAVETVVSPGNLGDWSIYTTNSSGTIGTGTGTGDFVNGPGTPPLGTGSVHMQTASGAGSGSVQLRNDAFAGTRLNALTELMYSTYATAWNDSQLPYLTIWLDTNNDGTRDDRLWFEPTYSRAGAGNGNPNPQADPALNLWQTWNVLTGMVYSDSLAGPGSNAITFADYLLAKPNATILNDAGQSIGGIRIATGFASAADNFNTNVDNFRIATAAGETVYNFELDGGGAVPEAASIVVWSFLASLVGGVFWMRRKQSEQV